MSLWRGRLVGEKAEEAVVVGRLQLLPQETLLWQPPRLLGGHGALRPEPACSGPADLQTSTPEALSCSPQFVSALFLMHGSQLGFF